MSGVTDDKSPCRRVCQAIEDEYTGKTGRHIVLWSELAATLNEPDDVPRAVDAEVRNALTHFSRALDNGKDADGQIDNAIWHLRNASCDLLVRCCELARKAVGSLFYYEAALRPDATFSDDTRDQIERLWLRCEEMRAELNGFASRSTSQEDKSRLKKLVEGQATLLSDYLEMLGHLKQRYETRDIAEIVRVVAAALPDGSVAHRAAPRVRPETAAFPELDWSPKRFVTGAGILSGLGVAMAIALGLAYGSVKNVLVEGWPLLLIALLAGLPVAIGFGFSRRTPP